MSPRTAKSKSSKGPKALSSIPKKKKSTSKRSPSKEIDPFNLDGDDGLKRLSAIYRLEKVLQAKSALYAVSKRVTRGAKAALAEAEDALEKEINEQRFGPGPLFPVGADGTF